MRNYQRQKNNPYKLPHNLYMRMLYLVRDYERIRSEREEILLGSPPHDSPSTSAAGNPTEHKGIKLAMLDGECAAVERAIEAIPAEYRKGVMNNICRGARYPATADPETFGRWRRRLLWLVAKNLNLL